ncbi:putative mucin TcMUCII [Trypanosoma cruzi]|nr:putative mucin TcMUCII [Trypanosoma cruzi]
MTTCRLLCALLVLALCCCPSVCASATPEKPKVDSNASDSSPSGTGVQEALQATSQPGPQGVTSVSYQDKVDGEKRVLTDRDSQTDDTHNPVNRGGTDGDTGLQSLSDLSAEQTHEDAEDRAKTTTTATIKKLPEDEKKSKPEANTNATSPMPSAPAIKPSDASAHTTTKAQTTTTATSTTTTTTTEAPTTTTTRAPSRLREIDGSLSSSAWVCAPLLLAVSALAYTTLG